MSVGRGPGRRPTHPPADDAMSQLRLTITHSGQQGWAGRRRILAPTMPMPLARSAAAPSAGSMKPSAVARPHYAHRQPRRSPSPSLGGAIRLSSAFLLRRPARRRPGSRAAGLWPLQASKTSRFFAKTSRPLSWRLASEERRPSRTPNRPRAFHPRGADQRRSSGGERRQRPTHAGSRLERRACSAATHAAARRQRSPAAAVAR